MATKLGGKQAKARDIFAARVKEFIEAASCSDFTSIREVDWEGHRIQVAFEDMPLLLCNGRSYEVERLPMVVVDLVFPMVAEPGQIPFRAFLVHPRNLAHPNYSGVAPIPLLCHGVTGLAVRGRDLLPYIHGTLANHPDIIRTDDTMNVNRDVVRFIREKQSTGIFPTDRRRFYSRRPTR